MNYWISRDFRLSSWLNNYSFIGPLFKLHQIMEQWSTKQKYRAEFHFFHSVGKKMNRKNSRPTEHLEKHKESSSFFIFIFQNCHSSLALKGIASKAIIIESLSKRFSDDYLAKESCNLSFFFFWNNSKMMASIWKRYSSLPIHTYKDWKMEGANMSGICLRTEEKAAVSGSRGKGTDTEQPYSL